MGTTVTTNLGLIKPDTDESIKQALPSFAGWASQNATNMDKVDALFRAATGTFTPTLAGGGVGVTYGSGGSASGLSIRLFPRVVIAYYRVFFGTTAPTIPVGTLTLTQPPGMSHFPAEFPAEFTSFPIGKGQIFVQSSAAISTVMTAFADKATGLISFRLASGAIWTNSAPTLGANDRISAYVMYPCEDS